MARILSTWRMSLEGAEKAQKLLNNNGSAGDAVETAIREVEENPLYRSVGLAGLPTRDGSVSLDSGYMDGATLSIGAVGSIQDFAHPISISRALSKLHLNNCLFGIDAERWASANGFERVNLHDSQSMKLWQDMLMKQSTPQVYKGHDTVCVIALDDANNIVVGTSTSGLFLKTPGRVGDSPMPGCGFYADATIGAAAATGVGEEIMKGCLSFDIVSLIKNGRTPQQACDEAVHQLDARMKKIRGYTDDLSVIAMDMHGNIGASTTIQNFSFVTPDEEGKLTVYVARHNEPETIYAPATQQWLDDYMAVRHAGKLEQW